LHGSVGSSILEIDDFFFSNSNLSWSSGGKLLLWQSKQLCVAISGNYCQSRQTADYLLIDKEPAWIMGDFAFWAEEIQTALCCSLPIDFISPYFGITYLHATLEPNVKKMLLEFSDNFLIDAPVSAATTRRNVGIVLGATWTSEATFQITSEMRFLDQIGFHLLGSLRF
jgi:hypothetical protein